MPLALPQLERHRFKAAANPRWYKKDGHFWVPPRSQYQTLLNDAHHNPKQSCDGGRLASRVLAITGASSRGHDFVDEMVCFHGAAASMATSCALMF